MAKSALGVQTLEFYRAYGDYVLYRIMPNWGIQDDKSTYLQKSAFPNPDGPYPDRIVLTIEVLPEAEWSKT